MGTSSSLVPDERKPGSLDTFITVDKKDPRLLIVTGSRVREVEGKEDRLLTAFRDLSLMINNSKGSLSRLNESRPEMGKPIRLTVIESDHIAKSRVTVQTVVPITPIGIQYVPSVVRRETRKPLAEVAGGKVSEAIQVSSDECLEDEDGKETVSVVIGPDTVMC